MDFGPFLDCASTGVSSRALSGRVYTKRAIAHPEFLDTKADIVQRIQASGDPDDDKFLEVAVNGRADVIVSGDGPCST
jgi:predicted nucleic acid-binding protein